MSSSPSSAAADPGSGFLPNPGSSVPVQIQRRSSWREGVDRDQDPPPWSGDSGRDFVGVRQTQGGGVGDGVGRELVRGPRMGRASMGCLPTLGSGDFGTSAATAVSACVSGVVGGWGQVKK